MFDVEKQKLENRIKEKNSRLQKNKGKQQEIEERENVIKEYEENLSSLKFSKKAKVISIIVITLALGLLLCMGIPFFLVVVIIAVSSLLVSLTDLKNSRKVKKAIKKGKKKYKKAKENEEKDKELKLALTEEYNKIEKALEPLNELLAFILKAEELQSRGYIKEQSVSEAIRENRVMEPIGYDEEYKPRVDNISVLAMKLPPESH